MARYELNAETETRDVIKSYLETRTKYGADGKDAAYAALAAIGDFITEMAGENELRVAAKFLTDGGEN